MRGFALGMTIALALLIQPAALIAATFQKIAMTGEAAPGTAFTFATFDTPSIDAAGDLLFHATDNVQRDGIWIRKDGSLQKVARYDDATPGRTGRFTGIDDNVSMNAAGQILFGGFWTGNSTASSRAIWTGRSGALTIAVAEKDPVPGISGSRFEGFSFHLNTPPVLDSTGQVAFHTDMTDSSTVSFANDTSVWKWSAGSLVRIIREGDAAPGTEPGVTFADLSIPVFSNPFRMANGEVAVFANVTGTGVTTSNNRGIWLGDGQTLTKIVRSGDPAPGGDRFAAIAFDSTSRVKLAVSDVGDVVFQANLVSGRHGLYRSRNGVIQPIALSDDLAPGGGTFLSVHSPVVTSSGKVAFWADLQDSTSTRGSLWTWSDGVLKKIVSSDEIPAAMPPGFEFLRLGGTEQTQNFLFLNDNGQMAFGSGVRNTTSGAGYSVLWGYDSASGIHLLAGPLQTLEGDVRTITPQTFVDERMFDGRFNSLNGSGQLAVELGFPIGGGVFLTSVPDPTGVGLLVFFMAIFTRRARLR